MQRFVAIFLIITIIIGIKSCSPDEVDGVEQYRYIYIPQAAKNPVSYQFQHKDSAQNIIIGLAYGGYDDLNEKVSAKFEVQPSLVDSFNSENGTEYLLLPESSYTWEQTEVFLQAGNISSKPVNILVTPTKGLSLGEKYILPVSAEKVNSNIEINPELNIAYFVVNSVLKDLDRSDWKVISVNSEEVNGEGPDNGHAKHALDGDVSTFWHTKWQGGNDPLPYIFEVDMSAVQKLNGFSFIQRQNRSSTGGNVMEGEIYLSRDGENYEKAKSFQLPNSNDETPVYFDKAASARYFKIIVNSVYDNKSFTHLAEIGAF